jgi:cytochrome P450
MYVYQVALGRCHLCSGAPLYCGVSEHWSGRAVEELLRYWWPIQCAYRTALGDHPVGAAVIPAGSRMALLWGSAIRDPGQFDDPA